MEIERGGGLGLRWNKEERGEKRVVAERQWRAVLSIGVGFAEGLCATRIHCGFYKAAGTANNKSRCYNQSWRFYCAHRPIVFSISCV